MLSVVLIFTGKKKKVSSFSQEDNRTVAIVNESKQIKADTNVNLNIGNNYPKIIGVTGYFTSKEFKIGDVVTVGRDPRRTKITFPDKTKGVSAVHMEIRNVSGRIEIVDLGSTYGTFLSNGNKLAQMVPYIVNKGDSFYLGDKENKFQVL